MAQMTEKHYKALKAELVVVKEKYAEALEEQNRAKELGDLSENAEYDSARRAAESHYARKTAIEQELADAEVVATDYSTRISIGSKVEVCLVDERGAKLEEPRQFLIDSAGCTVLDGVLGVNSSLGKVILNGTDGIYKIPDSGGLRYLVKKVRE